jgi:outer membrane protein assembly factor BamB
MWNYTTGDSVRSSPAVVGGVVYVGSGDGKVYALNATTGAHLWSYATGAVIYFSSPAIAGGMIFIGSSDDNVYALNTTIGVLVWEYKTGGDVSSSPAVANGIVYVGSEDDNVYAFGIHDVAVTNVVFSKTIVGKGYTDDFNITEANYGGYTETFAVTIYENGTAMGGSKAILTSGSSAHLTGIWFTAIYPYGDYIISVNVTLASGETNSWTGPFTYGTVKVTIPGDINGDGVVNAKDLGILATYWLQS